MATESVQRNSTQMSITAIYLGCFSIATLVSLYITELFVPFILGVLPASLALWHGIKFSKEGNLRAALLSTAAVTLLVSILIAVQKILLMTNGGSGFVSDDTLETTVLYGGLLIPSCSFLAVFYGKTALSKEKLVRDKAVRVRAWIGLLLGAAPILFVIGVVAAFMLGWIQVFD